MQSAWRRINKALWKVTRHKRNMTISWLKLDQEQWETSIMPTVPANRILLRSNCYIDFGVKMSIIESKTVTVYSFKLMVGCQNIGEISNQNMHASYNLETKTQINYQACKSKLYSLSANLLIFIML